MAISEETYNQLVRNLKRETGFAPPLPEEKKPSKYKNKKVTIGELVFPSMLEAKCFTTLWFQFKANLITEPYRQVWFSLGEHYGKERFYVADFVFVEFRKTGPILVVVDAKGHRTPEYLQKREMFWKIYGFCIREYRERDF